MLILPPTIEKKLKIYYIYRDTRCIKIYKSKFIFDILTYVLDFQAYSSEKST
jgi:hypothetical protein